MQHLLVLAYRNLWTRKTRTLVTTIGIILGVGTLLAVSITTASTTRSLKDFFKRFAGSASLTVTPQGSDGTGIRAQVLHRLERREGVQIALPSTFNQALLLAKDKEVAVTIKGLDPDLEREVNHYQVVAGQFLGHDDRGNNILLVKDFADKHGIQLHDEVRLNIGDEPVAFTVIGLLKDEGAAHVNNGDAGFVTLDVAQEVFERGNRVDRIDLVIDPRLADDQAALTQFQAELAAELGNAYAVTSPERTGQSIASILQGLNFSLGLFSLVALFVGALLIYNTFAMTVQERTRELGILRALGMTRRQIMTLVLSEAACLGLIGSLLGVGAGFGLSFPLINLMGRLFMGGITLSSFDVPVGPLTISIALGLITTLVASMVPAFSAGRMSPVEALYSHSKDQDGFLVRRGWIVGVILVMIWIADQVFDFRIQILFLSIFLGVTLMVPAVIIVLERGTRTLVEFCYGHPGRLGSMNLERVRGRAGLTVGVLMVGMVMTVSIGAMNGTFTRTLRSWIDSAVGGDLFVSSNVEVIHPDLARELKTAPGVEAVAPVRTRRVKAVGAENRDGYHAFDQEIYLQAVDPDSYLKVTGFQFQEPGDHNAALAAFADGDAVFISNVLSEQRKLHTGDKLRLRTARGEHDFVIAGVIVDFMMGGQSLVGSWRDLTRYMADHRVSYFTVKLEPGYTPASVKEEIDGRLGKSRHLEVELGDAFRRAIEDQIRSVFMLFDALVVIAVVVAALGVVNTMTMNVLERVREIGMLRGIGMTRRQVGRMILAEAAAMGVIGGLVGVVVGIVMSYRMVVGMTELTGWRFDYLFPTSAFIAGIVIVLVVSQVATLYPVWRAGRLNIVEAVQYEG